MNQFDCHVHVIVYLTVLLISNKFLNLSDCKQVHLEHHCHWSCTSEWTRDISYLLLITEALTVYVYT